jgi:DNA repair exonuclease SbcCD ATPase subunit
MMKRTISGIIGAGSLAHNRRDFVAENVDPDRVQLNICYNNENLKEVYKELFDDAAERYNVGKRKDRQIANYYEKIRQGKQEKLFHEVIFQIGNREDMAVQELEQKKEYLTAENEGLTSQIADARADIKLLEEEKIQFQKDKETAERRAEKAETELKKLEDRREFLQLVMDNVSKEIKEYGMIKTFLSEATALERAITYRDKKIKPLFIEMKNKIGAMDAQVKELTRERDKWKSKFQKKKQEHENTKKELAEVQKDYQKLSVEKEILQGIADRYNRLLRMLGKDMVERLVQDDIRMQAELEAKKQKEQMPKKISDRIPWAKERSEEYNAQIKKNKAKYRGMEL